MSGFAAIARASHGARSETRSGPGSALQRRAGDVVQRRLVIERGYYADRLRKPDDTGRDEHNQCDPRVRLLRVRTNTSPEMEGAAAHVNGLGPAGEHLEPLAAKPMEKTVQALTQSEHEVELSGLCAALPIIKATLG